MTTAPVPSQVRVVYLYAAAPSLVLNEVSCNPTLRWPTKHPMDASFFWIDATSWCEDIGATLGAFNPTNVNFSTGDGAVSVLAAGLSGDGYHAGIRFLGGTSGVRYVVTVTLNDSLGANTITQNILLPVWGLLPNNLGTPTLPDFSNPDNSSNYYF